MMDELEQLKSIIAEQDRRIQRMEAVNEITNVLGRYVAYHSASRQEETVELFCRHTPGIRLIFNGHIYDGWEGVLRHFIYRMANAEEDLSGRLYWHDVLSPVIEVAEGRAVRQVHRLHPRRGDRLERRRQPQVPLVLGQVPLRLPEGGRQVEDLPSGIPPVYEHPV